MTATNTQVVTEWVKSLSTVDATKVGPTLPADPAVWADTGFWQVAVVGGSPNVDLGLKQPVVEVSCWTVDTATAFPPYNRAEAMAADVLEEALSALTQTLSVQTGWNPPVNASVVLLGVSPVSEPMRVPDPRTGYARVMVQVQAWWDVS